MVIVTILGNQIRNCDVGIEFLGSSDNIIKYNTFKKYVIDIAINYVVGNNFITQNDLDSYVQVWMSDQPTIYMNYWSDYNGTDNDGHGIGDLPYFYHDILQDIHPLMEIVPLISRVPLMGFSTTISDCKIILTYLSFKKPKHCRLNSSSKNNFGASRKH